MSLGVAALRKRNINVFELDNTGNLTDSVLTVVNKLLELSQ